MENFFTFEKIVKGGFGETFEVKKEQYFTITNIYGKQVVNLMAFKAPDFKEYLSMSHSRLWNLSEKFTQNSCLVSNFDNPILYIEKDTFGNNDSRFPCCNKNKYIRYGMSEKHRSCKQNFIDNLSRYGIEEWRLPDPLNIFQNSVAMDDIKNIESNTLLSKPNDYITFKVLLDCIISISVCPFTKNGVNGGKATSVKITISDS